MFKCLSFLVLLVGCVDKKPVSIKSEMNSPHGDSISTKATYADVRYDLLSEDFFSADSVVLFSHHSPNMTVKDPRTGKYYRAPPFIEQDTINYLSGVQEKRKLNRGEVRELVEILILPAVDDSVKSVCFQPRNAVVIFKGGRLSCFDFCFDCYGFAAYGKLRSALIMNVDKYGRLLNLFKKYRFKYELD